MMRSNAGRPFGHGACRTLGILLSVVALVATCGGPAPSSGPGSPAPASPGVSSAPGTAASPGPGQPAPPPEGAWASVQVTPRARVASFEATRSGTAGAALDTAFRLTSLDGRDPSDLAARLVAEPALALKVGKAKGDTVTLRPASPLLPGQLYRFTLEGADHGTTEAAWAVQAAAPLRVVGSIPFDQATRVPRDTGIEITFNQPGVSVSQLQRRFEISPATAGRFEAHGRTIAFVPDRPLKGSSLFTITVRAGLPLEGTGMTLERDAVIRFETAGRLESRVHMRMGRVLFDAGTRERPIISLWLDEDEDEEGTSERVRSVGVKVHRLPNLQAALRAYEAIRTMPDWTWLSPSAPVRTAGLPRVMDGSVPIKRNDYPAWFQLPSRFAAGWYVITVTHAGVPRQAVLQVTDLATYAEVTTTRSAIWVNDVRSDDPVRGARVTLAGKAMGSTNADGLLVHRTPAAVADDEGPAAPALVVVRKGARATFVPVVRQDVCWDCWDIWGYGDGDADTWWHLFTADRYRYRTTDTVNLWGVVRERESDRVPASVTIEMFVQDWSDDRGAPVASTSARPDPTGSFVTRVPYADLPSGDYVLQLRVGDRVVSEVGIDVGTIAKPAWRMTLDTDRHALISGESVVASIEAEFFEGTPVAGAELAVSGGSGWDEDEGGSSTAVTTDADGAARATVPLRLDGSGQWEILGVGAYPTAPEEGDIQAGSQVAVFASTALLSVGGSVKGTRLAVEGSVNDVAFERFEDPALESLWDVDPAGGPRAGTEVRVRIVERIPVRRKTGTYYDFITKRVQPVYSVRYRKVDLGTRTVTTGADGRYRLELTVAGGDNYYEITAGCTDETTGRAIRDETTAYTELGSDDDWASYLAQADGDDERVYGVGETVRVAVHRALDQRPASRYLYLVEHLGLRSATVSTRSAFEVRFGAASVPTLYIGAVAFNGSGYDDLGQYTAAYDRDDSQLAVELTPDRPTYRPGDRVTIGVRTTGPGGRPTAASVFIRVLDERLYAVGGASDIDPLDALYAFVSSGKVSAARSHQDPRDGGKEGGDTGGGGGDDERSDFRDWLAATVVRTGADGRGSLTVPLSDDLTSWRVVGQAVDAKLRAGIGKAAIAVSLPLFAEATIASEYLVADRPVIRVRAYGTGLAADDQVTFRVSSDTLPMPEVTVSAAAFRAVEVPLPALTAGEHRLRIRATSGSGTAAREDVLVRTFRVVETRTVMGRSTSAPLTAATGIEAGAGFTTVTLVDAGRGRVVSVLDSLVWSSPDRADRAVASAIAVDVLRDLFGLDPASQALDEDLSRFQPEEGIGIVPWASADLELSALVALAGDPRIDARSLRSYFESTGWDEERDAPAIDTRDRVLWRLAGRAALGDPVLADVREAASIADLTPAERLTVALAALAAGDEDLAATLAQGLLEDHGQRFGPWVRLHRIPEVPDTLATARLAIVMASLGDPLAADMDAYVDANPAADIVVDLERALAARGWALRVPGAPARAAMTVDGTRREVAISPLEAKRFVLTPAQAAGTRLEPVSGKVLMVVRGEGPLDPDSLSGLEGVRLTREVRPAGTIGAAETVVVTYRATIERDALDGCWTLVDFVPSGLVPVDAESRRQYDDEGEAPAMEWPWRVEGQRVDFCVSRDPRLPTHTLRYLARVVTPGSYLWEPVVLQSAIAPDRGIVLPATTIEIEGLGR